ncbi:unnamed protein product [marine sediment metagenome]|uniref:Uncharacterized protein n=1 Tax=marine sediment metagenome TaxID=412755 RepID=X0S5Q8_9ZZZZ
MKDLWGSPSDLVKGGRSKGKVRRGSAPSPFSNSNSLQDMKTSTLSEENGGWGAKGVKTSTDMRIGKNRGKAKKSDKVFKSMGF